MLGGFEELVKFFKNRASYPGGRSTRAAGDRGPRDRKRANTRARGSDRHAGVPAGARDSEARTAGIGLVFAPLLLFDLFRWVAELVSTLVGIPGVRVTLLAVVLGGVFYASRLAGWMQVAGSWLRMATVIGGVVGFAIVLGMASGAVAVDVAVVRGVLEALLEVL